MKHQSLQDQNQQAQSEITNLRRRNASTGKIQSTKAFFNKSTSFKRNHDEYVGSFIGHLELYMEDVPPEQRLNVAISFLEEEEAFTWYQMVNTWQFLVTQEI